MSSGKCGERVHEDFRTRSLPGRGRRRAGRAKRPSEEAIAGDRGIPSINRARSVQSRVSSLLAITLMSTLGLGLLTWYYAKTLTRPSAGAARRAGGGQEPRARRDAAAAVGAHRIALRAQGVCFRHRPRQPEPDVHGENAGPCAPVAGRHGRCGNVAAGRGAPSGVAPVKSAGELAFERRLAGPAFAQELQGGWRRRATRLPRSRWMRGASRPPTPGRRSDSRGIRPGLEHALATHRHTGGGGLGAYRRAGSCSPRGHSSTARSRPRSTRRSPG